MHSRIFKVPPLSRADTISADRLSLDKVVEEEDWRDYHHIRRMVLFESRGLFGYDPNHPDEYCPTNDPLLLKLDRTEAVGTVRLDLRTDESGIVRLVAIRPEYQRQGVGRLMLMLVEKRARSLALHRLYVNSAPDATDFYKKLGFVPFVFDKRELDGIAEGCIQMCKFLGKASSLRHAK